MITAPKIITNNHSTALPTSNLGPEFRARKIWNVSQYSSLEELNAELGNKIVLE